MKVRAAHHIIGAVVGRSAWSRCIHGTCPSRGVSGTARAALLLTHRMLTFIPQGCNDVRRRYAAMPQDIDGAITRWRKASGATRSNSLIMCPADAAKRRRVALPPSRRATAQDGAPDDDQFLVRKLRPFRVVFGLEIDLGTFCVRPRASAKRRWRARWEKIMTFIIRVCASLFRIAQGRPQSGDPPGRNDFEGCCAHLIPPLDRFSPTMQGRKWLDPRFPLICCRVLPAMLWLRLTGNALPPGIGSCLERLTAPAITLIKLAGLDAQVRRPARPSHADHHAETGSRHVPVWPLRHSARPAGAEAPGSSAAI